MTGNDVIRLFNHGSELMGEITPGFVVPPLTVTDPEFYQKIADAIGNEAADIAMMDPEHDFPELDGKLDLFGVVQDDETPILDDGSFIRIMRFVKHVVVPATAVGTIDMLLGKHHGQD